MEGRTGRNSHESGVCICWVIILVLIAPSILTAATYTVINTGDNGDGSLRWAIESANSHAGPDRIEFNIDGSGPHMICPLTQLPELYEEVVIDGYSQLGSEPATHGSHAVLNIVLDGSSLEWNIRALLLINDAARNCEIRGLVICNSPRNGISVEGLGGNVIEGNYIGTDPTGTEAQTNGEFGIWINACPDNRIGGTTPAARNVISANNWCGMEIKGPASSGNQVLGNFIGTDVSGQSYLPNGNVGIGINNAPGTIIGGTLPGCRNVVTDIGIGNPETVNTEISGNYIGVNAAGDGPLSDEYTNTIGVHIAGGGSHNIIGPDNVISGHARGVVIWQGTPYNSVHGNYIGTDATGQVFIGNEWDGVTVNGSHNRIEGNVVSGSLSNGIYVEKAFDSEMPVHNVIADNIIGMNASGDAALPNAVGISINTAVNTTISGNLIAGNLYNGIGIGNNLPWNHGVDLAIGNRVTQNSIYDNGELGINLMPYGAMSWVTLNDPGDIDTGPNHLMNFPVLTSAKATPGRLIVTGTIDTQDPREVLLEFFANSAPDDTTGYGEGEMFLGTAKPNVKGKFTATLPSVLPGMWISATAMDSEGNTSEFSLCIEAQGPGKGK